MAVSCEVLLHILAAHFLHLRAAGLNCYAWQKIKNKKNVCLEQKKIVTVLARKTASSTESQTALLLDNSCWLKRTRKIVHTVNKLFFKTKLN